MATLSRGLFGPNLRPLLHHPRPALSELPSPSRLFTTSLRLRAAQPNVRSVPSAKSTKPSASPSKPTSSHPQSGYALVKSLATKPTPTVLYEGPSHFWFYFGCWSSGISILTWTALTGSWVVFQPQPEGTESIPEWVTWVNGSSYVLLAAMGFYLISKTPNIVKTIRVLPQTTSRVAPVAAPAAAATPATTAPTLQMEVTVNRMLPLLRPKTLTTDLDRVSLNSRLSLPDEYVPELRRQEMARQEARRAREQHRFDMQHLLTMPFRKIGRGVAAMFQGVRSAWTDMGFGVIKVEGKEYKVDVTKGFAHDGFRTLEKVVPVKTK